MPTDAHLPAALLSFLEGAENLLRGTGRTTRLIRSLKSGDIVVCGTAQEARRLDLETKAIGLEVRVIGASTLGDVYERLRGCRGQVHYEHTFIHEHFRRAIAGAAADLDDIAARLAPVKKDDAAWPDR